MLLNHKSRFYEQNTYNSIMPVAIFLDYSFINFTFLHVFMSNQAICILSRVSKPSVHNFTLFESPLHSIIVVNMCSYVCIFKVVFFSVLFSFHHYPSLVGALLYTQTVSWYLGLFIQSSQLLHSRLSLIADIVSIGCSVGL